MKAEKIISAQQEFFARGMTKNVEFRRRALLRLRRAIDEYEEELYSALGRDLGKAPAESYMCEIGLAKSELSFALRHLESWTRRSYVPTPISQFYAESFTQAEPIGCVLIMSPWNYPFLLSVEPLIGAIAAGCCAVIKPSAYAPDTARVIRMMIESSFPQKYIAVTEGGREANEALLEQKFDYIFFTGSPKVGRIVMEKAAKNLTPVTLELGGKSPCIVDETADLALAAKRIVFGKFLNAGQTCVAPDYILVSRAQKDALIRKIKQEITAMFGENPLLNPDYVRIVNQKHYRRLENLLYSGKIAAGGLCDAASLKIEPTVLDAVSPESPVMQQEIFGPILPVLTFEKLEEAIRFINRRPKPLACYLFTQSKAAEKQVLRDCSFGGGCINDTVIHLATSRMPFGGVGESGMGAYHGKAGFETFSHRKSIVRKALWTDLPVRYQPYTVLKEMLLRVFLK